MPSKRRSVALLAVALGSISAVAASSAFGGGAPPRTAHVRTIDATERDFAISLPKVVQAGTIDIRVTNRGPDQHEFLAVRAPNGALPLRRDGLTVDEEALTKAEIGGLEPGAAHSVRDLRVTLRPGRYVFFCNMSGHFMAGMHRVVTVK